MDRDYTTGRIATPSCGIQRSRGLQLAQMSLNSTTAVKCTIMPNLFSI